MSPTLLLLVVAAFAEPGTAQRELREARSTPDGVLLDFSATWCGPCQQMNPIVSKLEREGYPIRRVDIDQEKALATQYGVSSIPCFVLVVHGREQNRISGMTSEAQLRRMLQQIPAAARTPEPDPKPARDEVAPNAKPKNGFFGLGKPKKEQPPVDLDELDVRGQPADEKDGPVATGPLAASTRIQVRDDKGINFGTGTVVESKPGRTVILTCSHIFRNMTETSTIEVDVFEGTKPKKYVGRLLASDKEGDVGLITVPTDGVLPAVRVASAESNVKVDAMLFSIGCSGGEAPTRLAARVTALNRYLGPDNVECTGLPVAGRSGGGLFTQTGELVGVCFAADQKDRRGLYAGIKPVQALLAKGLGSGGASNADIAGDSPFEPDTKLNRPGARRATPPKAEARGLAADDSEVEFGSKPRKDDRGESSEVAGVSGGLDATSAAAVAAAGEAEVICIIRPKNQQDASRVVIINRASPRFLTYLQGELRVQPKPTSGRVEFPQPESEPETSERTVRVAQHEFERLERYQRSPESR